MNIYNCLKRRFRVNPVTLSQSYASDAQQKDIEHLGALSNMVSFLALQVIAVQSFTNKFPVIYTKQLFSAAAGKYSFVFRQNFTKKYATKLPLSRVVGCFLQQVLPVSVWARPNTRYGGIRLQHIQKTRPWVGFLESS